MIAYTSTVTSKPLLGLSVVLAAVAGTFAGLHGPVWGAVLAAVVVLAAGTQLSVVHLGISPSGVRAGYGTWVRTGRVIPVGEVADAWSDELGWAAVFGIGVPVRRRVRLTVRPGPTLLLRLRDGEHVRLSTPDPRTAVETLRSLHSKGGNP